MQYSKSGNHVSIDGGMLEIKLEAEGGRLRIDYQTLLDKAVPLRIADFPRIQIFASYLEKGAQLVRPTTTSQSPVPSNYLLSGNLSQPMLAVMIYDAFQLTRDALWDYVDTSAISLGGYIHRLAQAKSPNSLERKVQRMLGFSRINSVLGNLFPTTPNPEDYWRSANELLRRETRGPFVRDLVASLAQRICDNFTTYRESVAYLQGQLRIVAVGWMKDGFRKEKASSRIASYSSNLPEEVREHAGLAYSYIIKRIFLLEPDLINMLRSGQHPTLGTVEEQDIPQAAGSPKNAGTGQHTARLLQFKRKI